MKLKIVLLFIYFNFTGGKIVAAAALWVAARVKSFIQQASVLGRSLLDPGEPTFLISTALPVYFSEWKSCEIFISKKYFYIFQINKVITVLFEKYAGTG